MRHERPGERAAGNRLHHRRLDLEVAAGVEERADRGEHTAADLEHAPRVGIDDQIEIALPVADLDVAQAVPLLGQRQEALARNCSSDAQIVSSLVLVRNRCPLTPTKSPKSSSLKIGSPARQRVLAGCRPGSARRRRRAPGSSPCRSCGSRGSGRRSGLDLLGLELSPVLSPYARDQLLHGVGAVERMRVRIDAEPCELLEVRAPLSQLIGFSDFLWSRRFARNRWLRPHRPTCSSLAPTRGPVAFLPRRARR